MAEYSPTDLGLLNQTATTIELCWSISANVLPDIDHFGIRYHPVAEPKWRTIETDNNKNAFTITELKSETQYEFKVRSVLHDGNDSRFSEPAFYKTMASLTDKMKKDGTKLSDHKTPKLYKVPLEQVTSRKKKKTRKIKLRTSKYKFKMFIRAIGTYIQMKSWWHRRYFEFKSYWKKYPRFKSSTYYN